MSFLFSSVATSFMGISPKIFTKQVTFTERNPINAEDSRPGSSNRVGFFNGLRRNLNLGRHRKRYCNLRHHRRHLGLRRAQSPCWGNRRSAVSYTHLTLPTNREV